jgi:GrpB-like predicted nucleotidyltransferase (UPF0157 family)
VQAGLHRVFLAGETSMPIQVVAYDPRWPDVFAQIAAIITPQLHRYDVAIEHVGSTSVPGLAAKPVIDMDIVVRHGTDIPAVIAELAHIGYQHRGDLGIAGREAFYAPNNLPTHHLYLGHRDAASIRNHLLVRDYLRQHPQAVTAYAHLKQHLAHTCGDDIDAYVAGKSQFLAEILRSQGMVTDDVDAIISQNQPPTYTTPRRP